MSVRAGANDHCDWLKCEKMRILVLSRESRGFTLVNNEQWRRGRSVRTFSPVNPVFQRKKMLIMSPIQIVRKRSWRKKRGNSVFAMSGCASSPGWGMSRRRSQWTAYSAADTHNTQGTRNSPIVLGPHNLNATLWASTMLVWSIKCAATCVLCLLLQNKIWIENIVSAFQQSSENERKCEYLLCKSILVCAPKFSACAPKILS